MYFLPELEACSDTIWHAGQWLFSNARKASALWPCLYAAASAGVSSCRRPLLIPSFWTMAGSLCLLPGGWQDWLSWMRFFMWQCWLVVCQSCMLSSQKVPVPSSQFCYVWLTKCDAMLRMSFYTTISYSVDWSSKQLLFVSFPEVWKFLSLVI